MADSTVRIGGALVDVTTRYRIGGILVPEKVATPTPRLLDEFNRTSTTSPGTASTGQVWEAVQGTWGTDGANIYCVSGNDGDGVLIEAGSKTLDISTVLTAGVVPGLWSALVVRATLGVYDGYWIEADPEGRVSMASGVDASTATGVIKVGDTLRVTTQDEGSQVRVIAYVNGTQVLSALSETYRSGTRVGYRHGASEAGKVMKWGRIEVAP